MGPGVSLNDPNSVVLDQGQEDRPSHACLSTSPSKQLVLACRGPRFCELTPAVSSLNSMKYIEVLCFNHLRFNSVLRLKTRKASGAATTVPPILHCAQ